MSFNPEDLERLTKRLIYSLQAGRDLRSSLKKYLKENPSPANDLLFYELETVGFTQSARVRKLETQCFLERVFFSILSLESKGQDLVLKSLKVLLDLTMRLKEIERKKRSLLFLPKFQTAVTMIVTGGLVFALPMASPIPVPTFASLGRWDLLLLGLTLIVTGLWITRMMTNRVKALSHPHLVQTFFLWQLRILVESGQDLPSSWNESVKESDLSESLKLRLQRPPGSSEDFKDFLRTYSDIEAYFMAPLMEGLLNVMNSATDAAQFLANYSTSYLHEWFTDWEYQTHRLSALIMLPALLLVFPASFFLIIGPSLIEIQF